MFIRTAAFPLLLLCLACAGESPDAEPETVSSELVPDAARAPSCNAASNDLTPRSGRPRTEVSSRSATMTAMVEPTNRLSSAITMEPVSRSTRATGLAEGPDGAMYISDSVTGRIWRVVYTGS